MNANASNHETKGFYNWLVNNNGSLPLVIALSLLCPEKIVKSIYQNNQGRKNFWKGKKSCFTLSFDCDYPRDAEAIPYMLKLLAKYNVKSSFAAVGHWVEKYPKYHEEVVKQGHEILNHTYSHPDNELLNPGRKFREISRQEKLEEVAKCDEIIYKYLGVKTKGTRIPHFKNLFTNEIYGILKELGHKYSTSTCLTNTKSSGDPFVAPEGIVEIPLTTCLKHPFTVFDTWHSLNSNRLFYRWIHNTEREYQDIFKKLVDISIETSSYMNIYIDPYDIEVMKGFEDLLKYLKEREEDVLIARYDELLDLPMKHSITVHAA